MYGARKNFNQQNVGLSAISVFVIVFSAIYMFEALHSIKLDDNTYKNVVLRRYRKITDDFPYEFLRAFRNKGNIIEPFNIEQLSLRADRNVIDFISSIEPSILRKEIKNELISNAFDGIGIWNSDRMKEMNCLSSREIEKVFNKNDLETAWKEFYKKYGAGYHQFSVPIHDKQMRFVVVRHIIHCGSLCGEEELMLFKNIEGKWIEIKRNSVLIS